MSILGHGIDLIECDRIAKVLENHGQRFLHRVLTPAERELAGKYKNPVPFIAGRWAAKEAILKMIGTGWRGKIAWTDIEVINNAMGQPEVTLTGEVKNIAEKLGISHVSVSITHTANFAIASAVALAQKEG